MSPSRDTVAAPQPLGLPPDSSDGLDEYAPSHHQEESTLLGSDSDIHSPLTDEEEEEDHLQEVALWKKLPWWKRPSPYWMIFGVPLGSLGYSATLAPRVDMYTTLACRVHRPEYISTNLSPHSFALNNTPTAHAADQHIPQAYDGSNTTVDTPFVFLPDSTDSQKMDYTQNGPNSKQRCASDPVVQAAVARLNAVLVTAMGILACITTGWWGSLSDRFGRRPIVWISLLGLLATDITHIVTALFVDVLPGGYWFLLVGYLIEGFCGGLPTGVAVNHAYLADTTEPSTRSRYFSLSLGVMFAGVGVGPVLGGLLIRWTGTTLSAFYLATVLHGLYTILILLILPESLTRARARGALLRRRKEKANEAHDSRARQILRNATQFLSPLVILLPGRVTEAVSPLKGRRDWSLFFIAISYGLITSVMGSFSYKFQYAAAQFKWSSEITSYYIAAVGAVRAAFLALILPVIIKYLNPTPVQLPTTLDEPLRGAIGLSATGNSSEFPDSPQPAPSDQHPRSPSNSPKFDLKLARISIWMEVISYLSMGLATTGGLFTFASLIGSLGGGFTPASQALALEVYTRVSQQGRGEVGKLFGALSVIQALASQIISPALYGFIYSTTVSTFPQAIMVVSMSSAFLAFVALLFVRIPSKLSDSSVPGNEDFAGEAVPEILAATTEEILIDG